MRKLQEDLTKNFIILALIVTVIAHRLYAVLNFSNSFTGTASYRRKAAPVQSTSAVPLNEGHPDHLFA